MHEIMKRSDTTKQSLLQDSLDDDDFENGSVTSERNNDISDVDGNDQNLLEESEDPSTYYEVTEEQNLNEMMDLEQTPTQITAQNARQVLSEEQLLLQELGNGSGSQKIYFNKMSVLYTYYINIV